MKAGWEQVPLGEIALLQSGFAFKSSEYTPTGHRLIRIANVQDGFLSDEKPKFVALDDKTARFELEGGDLLTSLTGNVGRVAKMTADLLPAALNQRVLRIKPNKPDRVDADFLELVLKSRLFRGYLEDHSHGAAQANVSPKAVAPFSVPLPPLEEQQRIVAILDEAFEGLDRAKANAEANLASARELFQAALGEAFNPGDAVKAGWEEVSLGDLCSIARGGSPRPIKAFLTDADDGINWIKIGDTQAGGRYIDSTAERIKPEGKAKSRFVEPGAFLLSNSMSFGRPYVLRTSGCIHDGWLVLDPDYGRVDQAYLYYSLIAPETFAQFDRAAAGSTVRNLNTTLASKVTIPLPLLEEQQRIVERLDKLRERTSLLEAAFENAKENLDQLRQSLLSKAFAGELT